MMRPAIEKERHYESLGLQPSAYAVVTLHRPSNVDSPENLRRLVRRLVRIAEQLPLAFPLHPRTRKNLAALGLLAALESAPGVRLAEPLPYIPFMSLVFNCRLAITDSGGVQEETTYLGIPCITLRPNTERPVTVTEGTNRLCEIDRLEEAVEEILAAPTQSHGIPALWDGKTAGRVAASISRFLDDRGAA
jgi:UDP-N-acetylglucosamine 2-epimerase (non-hydrolysing)